MQTFTTNLDRFYDVGYQLTNDLRRRAQECFRRQEKEKAALTTVEAFEAHRERVREHFLRAIGGLPGPMESVQRTPLKAEVTGTLERETFTVEKLIYQSLPEFRVTAALYLPRVLAAPAPAVVMVHGHADSAKSYPLYQSVAIDLVNNGFAVLAIDPLGQGERHQYIEGGQRLHGPCTHEHTHSGLPFWLRGASLARHFIWDIMRGIDYLETRPEVDSNRIGITGNSGGGTQTCYTMLCEPRLAAAAPCTFVMTLESYQKSGQPQDAEQIIPGCMDHGPDHDDYITAMAPRPVMVGAAAYDFFPIEGAQEAVRRARKIYGLYGKEENLAITVAPTRHQYSPQLRQASVNWFRKHLLGQPDDFVTGSPELFEEEELWATKSGRVYVDYPDTPTTIELNQKELPPTPGCSSVEEARQEVSRTLGIAEAGDRSIEIFPRIYSDAVVGGYRTQKVFFFSAPDITVAGVMIHPRGDDETAPMPVTLLLLENGTDGIPASRPQIETLLRSGQRVLVFDVRGIGAVKEYITSPGMDQETFKPEYKWGCDAMMLGVSTLGLRVYDVLRGYDYLQTRFDVSEVRLHGVGSGAVFAFYAGLLEAGFAALTCEDMLSSYRDLCQTRDYQRELYNLKIMAHGLLQAGDFEDLVPLFAPREVKFVHPRNALGEVRI